MKMKKRLLVFVSIGIASFLIGVALTRVRSIATAKYRQPSPWQVLLSFQNQDLEGLKGEPLRAVTSAVEALTGKPDPDESGPYKPSLFRSISNSKGETRYLLVENGPLVIIPSESRLRVHVFDTTGRLLSTDDFGAGWRMIVTGMRVRDNDQIGHEALIVDSEYVFGGSAATHYYALMGDRLELVYATALIQGEWLYRPDRNSYRDSNLTVGPSIYRSAEDWEKALNSADNAEVLAALMWLGGSHADPKADATVWAEDRVEAEKFSTLRARDSVQRKLKELSEVNEQADLTKFWIKAAAATALRGEQVIRLSDCGR